MIAHYTLNAFKSVIFDFLNLVVLCRRTASKTNVLSVVVLLYRGSVVLYYDTVYRCTLYTMSWYRKYVYSSVHTLYILNIYL